MSAETAEIEDGEITDSDSMDDDQQPMQKSDVKGKDLPAPAYSMFADQVKPEARLRSLPRPPNSDSDSSESDGSEDDDYNQDHKRSKSLNPGSNRSESKQFVNPNFLRNGGVMPPLPKQSSRNIWGSVMQEQILTSEIGGFSMEKKVQSDRNVESYDYTRAKEDDRPHVVEDEIDKEEGLFGEVVDLEKAAFNQKKTLKRKHVNERLGQRRSVKDRLDLEELPPVTESSSTEEVTFWISTMLEERKMHLIRRVVQTLRPARALQMYRKMEEVEASGGMLVLNGSRRRTKGGVFLTLLKTDSEITKEESDEIFAEENQQRQAVIKRKKLRAKMRRKERKDREKPQKENEEKMEAVETKGEDDEHSRSSVEGQTGSPKNHADHDHLSDAADETGGGDKQESDEDSREEGEEEEREGDFQSCLDRELQRHAASQKTREEAGAGDMGSEGVTLDDVLDIGIDDDLCID